MSTSKSPLSKLKAAADGIAKMLKQIDRGEVPTVQFAEKIIERRDHPDFTFAVVQDDKILRITMTWAQLRETSEVALGAWLLRQMRGVPEATQ